MDGLVREYADAVLERPSKVVKRTKVPHAMSRTDVEKQVRAWQERGYDVSSVEANLESDPAVLTASVIAMREAVKKAEAVSEILDQLDVTGFESRAALLREKLQSPIRYPDVDAEVEGLRDAIDGMRRIEARRELELARERESAERTRKVLELVMRQTETLPPESKPKSEDIARVLEEPTPVRDQGTNLVPASTFESFVEGESNRFAHGAAVAVAKNPAKSYNPLLITSGPGLGKTHLLHAIGNYITSHSENSKVLYLTCEAFATNLEEARVHGDVSAFRERVRGLDCLMIDDIQFLSGMPEIHEEIFHTFNDLHEREKQIVLASDRPPKAIPNLDERLVSRFESGLVAGIEPPELATRIAILERRAHDAKVMIDPEVLAFIASLVENNVRELGGAFNRVVAFSSVMERPITQDLAREVLSGPTEDAAVAAPAAPTAPAVSVSMNSDRDLQPGRSYLIKEDRPAAAFRLFARFLGGRSRGLVITRTNPKRLRENFNPPAGRVLWLTDREGSSEETIAPALERLVYEIEDFMSKNPRGAVLLDGIEYLVSNNSFDAVLKFVRRLLDTVSESHYAFVISLGSATLKDQELKTLEREMEVIEAT